MYFKITNAEENHRGFQYKDGLNILIEEFNNNPHKSCCKGGLYFTDAANIFKFLDYGIYVREITLPTDNPDFKIIKDFEGDKWRANMIILGQRYDLSNPDTYEYLRGIGADIHYLCDYPLAYSAENGYLDVVKYLIGKGADVHAFSDSALRTSAKHGHLDIVKYLVECGADVHANNDETFMLSASHGRLDVVKYLIEKGVDVHVNNDYAVKKSSMNCHWLVYNYLKSIS